MCHRLQTVLIFIISGPGEQSFPELCQQILDEDIAQTHYIEGKALALDELVMPYQYYTDKDIRNRLIYAEMLPCQ